MSDPTKEPRCDAKLKNLPEERQAEIIAKLKADGFQETLLWLRDDGIKTSFGALSDFRSWHRIKAQHARKESIVLQVLEQRKKEQPSITPAELFEHGQMIFSAISLEEEDSESWARIQQLTMNKNLEEAKLAIRREAEDRMKAKNQFEIEKFQFDGAKAALKHLRELQLINSQKIPEAEKIQKVRERLFGKLPT